MKKNKTNNYPSVVVGISSGLMFISALVFLFVTFHFFYRIVQKDYSASNLRQLKIELIPYRDIDNKTHKEQSPPSFVEDAKQSNTIIWNISGEFLIKNAPLPLFLIIHFWDASFWGVLFYFFFLMRKFFVSFEKDKTFSAENIKLLKIISSIIILAPTVDVIVQSLAINPLLKMVSFAQGKTASVYIQIMPYIAITLFGYILYAFIKAFEDGMKLKEENDLTV